MSLVFSRSKDWMSGSLDDLFRPGGSNKQKSVASEMEIVLSLSERSRHGQNKNPMEQELGSSAGPFLAIVSHDRRRGPPSGKLQNTIVIRES